MPETEMRVMFVISFWVILFCANVTHHAVVLKEVEDIGHLEIILLFQMGDQ